MHKDPPLHTGSLHSSLVGYAVHTSCLLHELSIDIIFACFPLHTVCIDSIFTAMSTYKAFQLSKVGKASNIINVFVKEG